jgi:hypothetical protein
VGERVDETPQEKGHRQLTELLQELRVALPGVQVLFAFLLTVPFTQGWDTRAIVGLTVLALAVVGVVLLITDALYGGSAVAVFPVGIAALFIVLWYGIPIWLRRSKRAA